MCTLTVVESITLRASSLLRGLRVKLSRLQISREGREEAKDREGEGLSPTGLIGIACSAFSFHTLRLPAKAGAQDKLANGKAAKIFKRLADGRDACVLS